MSPQQSNKQSAPAKSLLWFHKQFILIISFEKVLSAVCSHMPAKYDEYNSLDSSRAVDTKLRTAGTKCWPRRKFSSKESYIQSSGEAMTGRWGNSLRALRELASLRIQTRVSPSI